MAGAHRSAGGLIRVKRAYDAAEAVWEEGFLLDRLWWKEQGDRARCTPDARGRLILGREKPAC